MKINDVSKISQELIKDLKEVKKRENVKVPGTSSSTRPEETEKTNTVEITSQRFIETAIRKAENLPEVREEKVNRIKEQVESGTYQVSNREIARAMIGSILNEII